MKKKKNVPALLLIGSLVFTYACKSNKTEENTSKTDYEESEIGVLKNYIKELDLKGFLGKNFKNNIKYWQKSAYKNNPNIITQIKKANENSNTSSLSEVLGQDYFGVDGYYDIDVVKKNDKNYIGFKLKSLPTSFGDRDFRFVNDINAITSWQGIKELWVYVDNSEIGATTGLRLCFEDNSVGRESYKLIDGKEVNLYKSNGEAIKASISEGGFVSIPANFEGYVALPFNKDYYECYWCEGGNRIIDSSCIAQFQIAIKGSSTSLNKTFRLADFAIVGSVAGNDLPINTGTSDTYKVIWDINLLRERSIDDPMEQPSGLARYGEFVGKLLTGISFSYKATKDEELFNAATEIINELEEAQGEDGYLGVFKGQSRYSIGSANWDLWNQYHAVVGLLEWYKLTNNEKALTISKKCLDAIYETFKDRSYLVKGGFETNRAIAHAYALMYQVNKEEKYLNEAERIIMQDCQDQSGWYKTALRGGNFYRSSSARWEVLHMIMTLGILFEETKNEEYYNVLEQIWYDIQSTDIHNTGGFTTNEGAIGDPYKDGVIETCCTIAWCAFTNEFYKYSKKVEVLDELERSYFNGILGAQLDDDKYCSYNTPMNGIRGLSGGYDGRRVSSQQDISFQFNSGSPDMNCCQANFARGIGQIVEWACLTDGPSLYLNYYGNSTIKTSVNGASVTIKEVTSYPLNGNIKITIEGLEKPTPFKLKLRIPSWSFESIVKYDSKTHSATFNEYYEIDKVWKNGDEIELNLDLHFSTWLGERSQSGYASLYYGPILFTLDEYYLNKYCPQVLFSKNIVLNASNLEKLEVQNGNTINCLAYIDVPYNGNFVRLVDFASAGKYNGGSSPSSYYSWFIINGIDPVVLDPIDIWKNPLF
ncbi:MAG: glycoside hydrolase family 127 protein [Bacilli bacterium]|nr:glycoside hydrolase family 127 protein [Bacilli bacterium]